jgi:hypothetical protein
MIMPLIHSHLHQHLTPTMQGPVHVLMLLWHSPLLR